MLDWLLGLINKRQRELYKENQELRKYKQGWEKLATAAVQSQVALSLTAKHIAAGNTHSVSDAQKLLKLAEDLGMKVDHAIYHQLEAENINGTSKSH
ncbi:hypothetical protein ASESINO_144 [Erwinia phage vB_EamM_Asesino]|uniref:Uncharacterized protein n=1 Tax=Erwinia phage vB_EamM_Asesino TaxID=1883370 RepID=A0A1B2IA61_9CAUD|nr:hypothetical protein ASESINO_144 [Erwinia phage vB_EamM_Asesino]ANZ48157.1 hypothetical protein ASESINO_144 [Erwinia phage vB_EamM_Asesino]